VLESSLAEILSDQAHARSVEVTTIVTSKTANPRENRILASLKVKAPFLGSINSSPWSMSKTRNLVKSGCNTKTLGLP